MYDVVLRHYANAGDGASSNDYVIHSYKTPNDHSRKLLNPNLDIEENTAGTLKFTVPPGNAGNGYTGEPDITMGTDEIIIRRTVVRKTQDSANNVLQVYINVLDGHLSTQFSACVNGSLDINWGDNSEHFTMTGSSIRASRTKTHPYSAAGSYIVTLTPASGTSFKFENMATEFWRGFPETSTKDFYNNVEYTCLGELAYLSDTVQEKKTYNYNTQDAYTNYPREYLKALIAVHNAHCGSKKRFTVLDDDVTVTAQDKASKAINRTAEAKFETSPSQTTFECIQNLISNCGGHLEVYWGGENGATRYLKYLKDYSAPGSGGPPIVEFATNLVDYTRETDLSDLITVLYPYGQTTNEVDSEGKLVKDSEGNVVRKTVDIRVVNNGSPYIEYIGDSTHPNYLEMFGRHEGSVTFSNVTDASNLLQLAKLYLYNQPFVYETLSCKAVDIIYASDSLSIAPIDYLKKVKVKSVPHNTGTSGKEFVVTKLSLPIDNPEETIYSMSTGARKTQQISTSVKDHDDKQKDTDDTIGEIGDPSGGGGGGGGGGSETITGADGRTGWVIGRTYIAKDAATAKGSEYMPHAEHLKLWYDSSTEVSELQSPVKSGSTYTYTTRGGTQATGYVYIGGTAIYRWDPCFIAEELTTIDDPSSYAEGNTYGFAHINGSNGLPILLYYAGPNLYGTYRNTDPDYDIDWVTRLNIKNCSEYVLSMNSNPQVQSIRYAHGQNDSVEGSQTPTYVNHSSTYVPFPPDSSVDGYSISGGHGLGHLFTPWVVGTMPMPQRPFYSASGGTSSQKAVVVYAVVNFVYGFGGAAGGISTADSANSALGSVNSSNMNSSRPTGIYCGGSGQAAALYNIEDIVANSSASTRPPSFAQGAGNYNVYAWVRNISKGTKFPFSSKEVGGLFVCAKGQVLTGFKKWTRNYNAMASAMGYEIYRNAPEFGTTDTPKNQLLWLNGHGTFDGTSGSLSSQFDGHAAKFESGSTTGIMSIRAIGYCLSGSGQMTSDEVIDNLRAIYSKYGR